MPAGRNRDDELDREIRDHLELEAEEAGSAVEARRSFGNVTRIKEDTRAVWAWTTVEQFAQDLRYALRTARKSPGFTAAAVVSLALGIGANTAIFTFVNAALLKPLPYDGHERIVSLRQRSERYGLAFINPRSFLEWHDRSSSFEAMAIAQAIPINTEGTDGPEQVSGVWSTEELFAVFSVKPFLGRVFTAGEARAGAARVVVLSHDYWRRRFGSDPNILQKPIRVERGSATIVGVLPAGFRLPGLSVDIYMTLPLDRSRPGSIGSRGFQGYGRLKPGVTVAQASEELKAIASRVGHEFLTEQGWTPVVVHLQAELARQSRTVLLVLSGVVACVLLIACANVAGLLLARGVGRRREITLRSSLGAGRMRLVRQLLVESLVLSVAGGTLAVGIGAWASRGLASLAGDAVQFGQMNEVGLDGRVLAFTAAISMLAAVVFGLLPAWQASRVDSSSAARFRGSRQGFRAAMVVAQVALAVVLLVGAGLLLRSFTHLLHVNLGFEPQHALTMRLFITGEDSRRAILVDQILQRVETLPEVRAAGTVQFLPFAGWHNSGPFRFLSRPNPPQPQDTDIATVSRGYFAAMGIPLLQGRDFGIQDHYSSPRVALVNQLFVDRYCGSADPVGMIISGDWRAPKPTEIIGVVGDSLQDGVTATPRPSVFISQSQTPGYITTLVARTSADPGKLATAIRRAILQVDPNQPVTNVRMMDTYVAGSLAQPKLYSALTGAFAALALALAAVGLYGLMAHAVSCRTHEIGIRMALGARAGDVLGRMLRDGVVLVLIGLATGVAGAAVLTRFVSTLLHGVTSFDGPAYAGAIAILAAVAMAAAFIPARRASRVDPTVALRYE